MQTQSEPAGSEFALPRGSFPRPPLPIPPTCRPLSCVVATATLALEVSVLGPLTQSHSAQLLVPVQDSEPKRNTHGLSGQDARGVKHSRLAVYALQKAVLRTSRLVASPQVCCSETGLGPGPFSHCCGA